MKATATKAAPKVGIVSLGCPKALVDSERILTKLRSEGYVVSDSYDGADVVIVNTCGFLNSARQESLDAIGEALKENGKVIVTGCMGGNEQAIRSVHPDVLSVTGPQQYESVVAAVHKAVPPKHDPYLDLVPPQGLRLTPRHYAYLKISEGCNNRCTFCIIPSLRGDLVSRPMRDVLVEAENLARAGVKELLVISQDTSAYGVDIKYAESKWRGQMVKARMTEMCEALSQLGIWVRLHYVYPYPHVDEVIPLMAEGKILPYLDIPFQHASPRVLKAMRRPANQEKGWAASPSGARSAPTSPSARPSSSASPARPRPNSTRCWTGCMRRSSTASAASKYEPVEGAKANEIADHVDEDDKQDRYERFMEAQRQISEARMAKKVGKVLPVLIDNVDEDGAAGRSPADAPEIDGNVFLDGETKLKTGDLVQVKVEEADEYDLWGSVVR